MLKLPMLPCMLVTHATREKESFNNWKKYDVLYQLKLVKLLETKTADTRRTKVLRTKYFQLEK